MGKIIAYCRVGCPHSENTISLLNNLKHTLLINHNTSNNIEIINVANIEDVKQELKFNLKQKYNIDATTFPIILYETSHNEILHIKGGNSELQKINTQAQQLIKESPDINPQKIARSIKSNSQNNYLTNNYSSRLLCFLLLIYKK